MTKILLVEDDKSLREIYGVRLLAEGYDIISAGDGEQALAMAIKERPSLIVSDVMMPKISGFDMLDILRSTTETKDIKVIMMTALSSEDQRARGEALGADRYLVKSQVGIEDVVRTVHDVLGDAPVSAPTAAQTFNTPSPTPRPAAPSFVPPRPNPTPAAFPQQPAPTPIYQPQTPAPAPQSAPQPQPSPAPAPTPSSMPQPTAPFSTARPANLGDRIIHPITPPNQGPKPDLGSLIDQELSKAAEPIYQPPQAPTPPPPAPNPVSAPQNDTLASPSQPQMPQSTPQQPAAAPHEDEPSGISFEETPRPPQTPPTYPGNPQPPTA